jgi:hypothetical protein
MTSASAVVAAIEVTYEANKGLYLGPMIVGCVELSTRGLVPHSLIPGGNRHPVVVLGND